MHAGERRFAQPAGIYYTKTQNKTTINVFNVHNGLLPRLTWLTFYENSSSRSPNRWFGERDIIRLEYRDSVLGCKVRLSSGVGGSSVVTPVCWERGRHRNRFFVHLAELRRCRPWTRPVTDVWNGAPENNSNMLCTQFAANSGNGVGCCCKSTLTALLLFYQSMSMAHAIANISFEITPLFFHTWLLKAQFWNNPFMGYYSIVKEEGIKWLGLFWDADQRVKRGNVLAGIDWIQICGTSRSYRRAALI